MSEQIGEKKAVDQPDIVSELEAALGGIAEGLEVQVYQVTREGPEYLFGYDSQEYSARQLLDLLRDEYGTGKYLVQARHQNGAFALRRQVAVRSTSAPGVKKAAAGGEDMAAVFRESMTQMQTLMMQQQLENSRQMIEILKTVAGGGQRQEMDVLGMLAALKSLMPATESPVEVLLQGMALGEKMGSGKSGDESGLAEVVKTLGAPLMEMVSRGGGVDPSQLQQLQQLQKLQQLQQGQQGQEGQPSAQAVAEDQAQNSSEGGAEMYQQMVRAVIDSYVKMAEAGKTTKEAAEKFLSEHADSVPDEYLMTAEGFETMFGVHPGAGQYREWFEQVRQEVARQLYDYGEEAGE